MNQGKCYTLAYKRKRHAKTDYSKRLRLIQSGKARFVVRRMLNNISVQIVHYASQGDHTLAAAHSRELLKHGWKAHCGNLPAAYLTGLLAGFKARKKGISAAVLDIGLAKAVKGSAYFAALKGALDAGLEIPHAPEVLPPDNRLTGQTIVSYAQQKPSSPHQFSHYSKNGLAPASLPAHLTDVKKHIITQWK